MSGALLKRVTDAIRKVPLSISSTRRSGENGLRNAEEVAQAAFDACRAEELLTSLRDLLEDSQHRDHDCGDSLEDCPVLKARALLAKLDGRS